MLTSCSVPWAHVKGSEQQDVAVSKQVPVQLPDMVFRQGDVFPRLKN